VSAPNSSLLKQSHNAEKVCAASPPPKPLSVHQPGEQAGERDVAAADVSMKAVVDNVEQGDTLSSAMVEPSNAVDCGVEVEQEVEREEASLHGKLVLKDEAESSSNRSGSESSITSSLSEETSDDDASNGSSASGNAVDAFTVGVSNTSVFSTAEVIAAVAASTFASALSATKLFYWKLGDKVLAKESGGLLASLVQHADERKEVVHGPGSSSSNSADNVSYEEEEDVHHPKEDMVPADVVETVGKVGGAFSSAMLCL
jgi:hypothetical protein